MQAKINFGKVQMGVVSALDAPITKPHCHVCGMPFNLHANDDGTWTCARCAKEQANKGAGTNARPYHHNEVTMKTSCPACGGKRAQKTEYASVFICKKCGAVYGTCGLGESYDIVLPCWDESNPPPEKVRYYDLRCLGSEGIRRRHGWYNIETKRIVQVG
jgi:ribosomal protein L37AE/L43A